MEFTRSSGALVTKHDLLLCYTQATKANAVIMESCGPLDVGLGLGHLVIISNVVERNSKGHQGPWLEAATLRFRTHMGPADCGQPNHKVTGTLG